MTADQVLEYAALAEQYSTHPIAVSLRDACKSGMDRSRVSDVEEIAGHGILAKVDGEARRRRQQPPDGAAERELAAL